MRVLIIDDDPNIAESVRRMLPGHDVVVNHDAASAIELAKTSAFELVVSDYQMPALSGADVVAMLTHELDEPPMFIVMSGDGDLGTLIGCDATIEKPFRAAELRSVIAAAIRARATARTRPLRRTRFELA
jgi:two-component system, OmpR family, response regulator